MSSRCDKLWKAGIYVVTSRLVSNKKKSIKTVQAIGPVLFMRLVTFLLCCFCLFVWLVGFLTSSSTTRLYRGRVSRLKSDNFTCCHTRDRAGLCC